MSYEDPKVGELSEFAQLWAARVAAECPFTGCQVTIIVRHPANRDVLGRCMRVARGRRPPACVMCSAGVPGPHTEEAIATFRAKLEDIPYPREACDAVEHCAIHPTEFAENCKTCAFARSL